MKKRCGHPRLARAWYMREGHGRKKFWMCVKCGAYDLRQLRGQTRDGWAQ